MIEIRCPHCTGVVKDFAAVVPDYYPLTREDITALLLQARLDGGSLFRTVFVRLQQGIVGMVCPPPAHGPLAERSNRLLGLLIENFRRDPTPDAVERIFQILNG